MFSKTPVTVEATQRALHMRDGKIEAILQPGRHKIADYGRRSHVTFYDIELPLIDAEQIAALELAHPKIVGDNLDVVRTSETEVAVVHMGNQVKDIVAPNAVAAYWKGLHNIKVNRINVADAPAIERREIAGLTRIAKSGLISTITVPQGHEGFAYVDSELRERLKPGVYAYWSAARSVLLSWIDLRRQTLEVTAQEILTKDRVSVRVTLTAFWQVSNGQLASTAKDLQDQLYRHIQFAIRDATASRTLDELLNARGQLDDELTGKVRSMGAFNDLGVTIDSVGVKDIILPGEMREILNKVVEAEKQAQANLIRRQEETAATRSLLNTARLMENNPLLLRMKELETLEKLTEKVGRLDVTTSATGSGLDALVNNLVTLAKPKSDSEGD